MKSNSQSRSKLSTLQNASLQPSIQSSKPHTRASKGQAQQASPKNSELSITFGEQDIKEDLRGSTANSKFSANKKLFEGLTFFIEVFYNDVSSNEEVSQRIVQHGGKVVKQLTKNMNYYIYHNGRPHILKKVVQNFDCYSAVNVVNPSWLEDSITNNQILDSAGYQPENYEAIVKDGNSSPNQNSKKAEQKKRKIPPSEESKTASPMKSKRQMKASEKKHSNRKRDALMLPETIIEEVDDHNPLFDLEELNKTIQQIQEEKYFLKEFNKDLKKFTKQQELMQQQQNDNENQLQKQKRETRYMNKNQLIDSFIEGDIEIGEFIQHMGHKMNTKKGTNGRSNKHNVSMKRLTEIYKPGGGNKGNRQSKNEFNQDESSSQSKLNKTAIVTLQDFLYDIDKENTPVNTQAKETSRQTNLNFAGKVQEIQSQPQRQSIFNFKPLTSSQITQNCQRITKSSTFNQQRIVFQPIKEVQNKEEDLPLLNNSFVFHTLNLTARRAHSLNPSKSQKPHVSAFLISPSKIVLDMYPHQTQHNKFSKSGQKEQGLKKKKEWEKILPQRKMPSRHCKMNVSYIEPVDDGFDDKVVVSRRRVQHQFASLF